MNSLNRYIYKKKRVKCTTIYVHSEDKRQALNLMPKTTPSLRNDTSSEKIKQVNISHFVNKRRVPLHIVKKPGKYDKSTLCVQLVTAECFPRVFAYS